MLVPNRETGAIEENWNEMIAGQTPGDAPLVCVVPDGGVIQSGAPVTDLMGVTYTPVRLPGGLSAYRYFQPNNDHYAKIVESNITDDLNSSPKTTTAWAKVRFIDKVATERIGRTPRVFVVEDVTVMEVEVQKTTRWGSPLSAPEFEYQARVASYGAEFQNARAVFLPDRLIEGTEWATVWKSGSSQNQLGPTNPVRAAAIPGLAPMTYIARIASLVSRIPGLSSIGVGVDNFYKNNGFEIDLFEGLIGNFHAFDDNPHFIHSEAGSPASFRGYRVYLVLALALTTSTRTTDSRSTSLKGLLVISTPSTTTLISFTRRKCSVLAQKLKLNALASVGGGQPVPEHP